MEFKYEIRQVGDVTVLDLGGRMVFGQGAPHQLHEVVREQIRQGRKKILINLRDLGKPDTSGLGALVSALTTVANHGGVLRFCSANKGVAELLRMTRLDTVFKVAADEASAMEAFSARQQRMATGT